MYDEYDGAFPVDRVISPLEFTYKLNQVAVTAPATSAGNVNIFMKSPTLKMYYGHQYIFDLSHSSLVGGNLSFAKDSLYKLEYSFNSIERVGTPGVTGAGAPNPSVKLKVDGDIVTNISYYFDPSRTGADSPVVPGSYLDVVDSPYKGNFEISSIAGATITRGADIIKFPLLNEPEGAADINQASYATSSLRAVGSINAVRIVNPGGFYTRLPIVSSIQSTRQIERVQINDPGTEYAVGTYTGVPIAGDGEGGFVTITVADGTDSEGVTIPGQIQSIIVTSPGKGYTTASIDIESVSGILGSGLTGSGAEVVVVIPPFGSGASIFTQGSSVGKIKKLKNNNFGYDYPHDYTLRPEITFPINAQLTSTSILDSITVTDPGTGYSQAPAVVITGGGGSGAVAEATIKNGRLDTIIVKDPGAGYSSTPTVSLRSSFNYVVNLDLGLLQFAFPHGITNGAAVTLNVVDTGDGADFPLSAGAVGRLNGTTTYYAIAGAANSLEPDQLKLAITSANAALGDALSFVNAGNGRQQVLTESFGGSATANVITSTFLEGELVYQGESLDAATATGYVSTNAGWQIGPRVLKIVDYSGEFSTGQRITGVISKSSGIMSDIKVAKGVLEIGSITKTTGQFIDDVGKPSEIIQKIQDSYYYQDFSYAVKSAVSIGEWKEILIKNVHPASFKVFGELDLNDYGFIPNKETSFQLTKSVELARDAIVPNIQNFALVEPVYSEFNNTEVLFRQKRLTSSENILTSVVQRLDDISNQFDGQKIAFPLTVDGNNVVANANQLMIVLNGVVQTPETAFEIQGDSIVFAEPPQPPASVKYVNVQISPISTVAVTFNNISGIFPTAGMTLVGTSSAARLTVTTVVGDTINGFITQGTYTTGELVTVGATGFAANIAAVTPISNIGLFIFGENVTNLTGDTAKVEQINLASGAETPLAQLRYTIGAATTSIEMVAFKTDNTAADYPVTAGVFVAGTNYQLGSEIFRVDTVTTGSESTTLTVTRGQNGTQAVSHQEDAPAYGTDISITNDLTLSKIAGTYQSTPGLFDIQLNDVIIGAQSGVVATVTQTSTYQDPTTQEFIGQVNISEGSSFFGLLFNRITSQTYPNVVLDNISQSQIGVVDFTDNSTAFDSSFPANEQINNYVIPYDNAVGTLQQDEYIRNYKVEYGNNSGEFQAGEDARVRKLTFTDRIGSGFFQAGQIIRSRDTKAEVVGANSARSTIFLGKIGRSQRGGLDYNISTFAGNAQLDTAQKKFGSSSLLLDGAGDYISTDSSSDFAWGSAGFTIECYIRPSNITGTRTIFDFRASSASEVAGRLYLEAGQVRYNVNGSDLVTSGATTITADTWTHVVVQRTGTTTKIVLDGVERGTGTDSSSYVAKPFRVGMDYADANGFIGHIDEIRLSSTTRYSTLPFTPQNGIFQGDSNAKLLYHLDGADGQTYTDDWSGTQDFTIDEYFNNDAIRETQRQTGATAGFNQKTHRYINAADNIILNRDFIAQEAVYIMKARYPFFTVLGGEVNCEDDVRDILDAMVEDLRNGSNSHVWDAAALYVDRTTNPITLLHVSDDLKESLYTYEIVGKLVKYVVNNTPWSVQGDHGFTQKFDTTITDSDYVSTSLTQFTASGATYNPATGDMVVTSTGHGLTSDTNLTASNSTYDAVTGVLNITSNGHNLQTGDRIQLADNSLTFTCTMDGNATNHTYPRAKDPAAQGWLEVTRVDANNFTINVGKSPIVNYQPTTGTTYDPATGLLKMFIGDHNLAVGTNIKLTADSLSFTCTTDGNTSVKTYPRASGTGANAGTPDPAYNTALAIIADGVSSTATGANYNPATGVLQITQNAHGFVVGDKIRIADNSLSFTCTKDGNHETKTYPRSTDPFSGRWLRISAKTDNTFTVNVGPSSAADQYAHTFVSAAANGIIKKDNSITVNVGTSSDTTAHTFVSATSNAVITGGNYTHTFVSATSNGITVAGDAVYLADGAISFTCSKDGNQKITAYPRSTDPASKQVLKISAHTTDTFTINVGASSADDQYTHTFSSAVSNSITKSEYNLTDCVDVQSTAANLLDIITDTLENAAAASPVDHLATVTKVLPAYEFVGGTVNAYTEVPFIVDYHDAGTDQVYTNQIDVDARGRFRDASNLIKANRKVIVDKAAYDMLQRYPDLALSMPRNANGTSTDGTLRCKTDLGLILDGLADDLYDGGNLETITAAKFYIGNSGELQHIRLQVWQSVYAHERLGFYAKQAVTGDLTYDNTDGIIVGDWGITNDAGGCANVKTAIDNLVTTINDIIAPTGSDFEIAADRLYFNRNFIAEEITGLITSEFTYLLNNVQYQAFTYPNGALGEAKCQRDLKLIIESAISDLQTGGNNSTIDAIAKYLTAALTLNITDGVEQELLATVYGIEQLEALGKKAIDNLLYANGEDTGGTAGAYSALHTDDAAVRDALTITDAASVKNRWSELIEIAVNILAPSKKIGRSAAKHVLYNRNYFLQEIETQTVAQFGAGSWIYTDFVNTTVDDLVHDLITTDTKKKTTAYNITITGLTGVFQVGEVIRSNVGGYATVLEFDAETNFLVVGPFTGTAWVATNTLTGKTSGATATVGAVGSSYDWYTEVGNVRTLASARLITSNISGQIAGTNLWTNPEAYGINWTPTTGVTITDNQGVAPDDTQTAEDVTPNNGQNGQHEINRDYNLTAFETFDSGTVTFDTSNESFDTGSPGTSATQQFTFSGFVKASGSQSIRFQLQLDPGGAGEQNAFFDLNLTNGTTGTVFTPQGGITADAFGAIPLGDGWYRCYITATFSFGFNTLRSKFIIKSGSGATVWTGDGSTGILVWGAKLTKGGLDPYQAQSGKTFFSDTEFNTKNYILDLLQTYTIATLDNSLTSPSPSAGFYSFYSSTDAANYTKASVSAMLRANLGIIRNQLSNDTSYIGLTTYNGISLPTKNFGTRNIPVGFNGGLNPADFAYGLLSSAYAEVESVTLNEGLVVQVYSRFRIDGDITDGPYTMNETVAKQGAPSITGVVYGFHEDANFKYLDVRITAGPWAITDNIVGATNSTTAQISAIETRVHIINLKGDFVADIPFKGYTSGATAQPTSFLKAEAAVTDNTGGKLTVDTASLLGTFEKTAVVYPSASRQFITVSKYAGLDIGVGDRIASVGYKRFGINIISGLNNFTVGNRLYKVVSGVQDSATYGIITDVDIANNYVYMIEYQGTFTQGDQIGDYGLAATFPVGYASISTIVTTAGAGAALVQDVRPDGINKRLYLSDVTGSFGTRDAIKGPDQYGAVILAQVDLKARVKRSFKGFDGTQTTFDLSQNNGTSYLPDPAGHLLIFINGILQPPGATNAYTAFSNQIQFTEAPDLGASFTGFYIGKLRQLDDISFEFDSLRQSFNLKRNDVFYSLTLTDGVQSSVIRPENNIICSLNGVIQEPGVGFEIVGSRIIFSEIPRFGSTFVAFSYVGSEADVDAAEVVPPIEPGDFIDIQGETADREVAVIESSNSLITFDYLGSVFGQNASATAVLTSGFIDQVQVTGGGSGYTSRPTVRIDSISGFDGNIRALVGVAGVELSATGSGYQNPGISVDTVVPDDYVAPDLSLYGEELVDPETP